MSPVECIASLDRALAETGQDITLRRAVASNNLDVTCRAFIRFERILPEEVGSIRRDRWMVILSPSSLLATNWPGGAEGQFSEIDPAVPAKTDMLIINGIARTIRSVDPVTVQDVTVRYNLHLFG